LAQLFADSSDDDGDGNTIYDPTPDPDDVPFELGMRPYDFGSAAEFKRRVDLSQAGWIMDCAKCHVGGAAAEYVPAPNLDDRVPLRNFYTETFDHVVGSPTYSSSNYTAFNYFIDIFDVDGNNDKSEVKEMDYRQTGSMEMDCFVCHLQGYKFNRRGEMLREARIDASRSIAAGIAEPNDVAWAAGATTAPAGYGTQVYYQDNGMLTSAGSGTPLAFSSSFMTRLNARPQTRNCAFCHFNQDLDGDDDVTEWDPVTGAGDNFGASDWKKRGDSWMGDSTHEVHTVLGCLGCHEGKTERIIGDNGDPLSPLHGQCDPAKGDAPFSTLWDANDNTMKTCADCHLHAGLEQRPVDLVDNTTGDPTPDGVQDVDTNGDPLWKTVDCRDYGAPNPTGAHQAAGLTSMICQTAGDGVANASHLDLMKCTVCHVNKVSTASWNNGVAIIDATGPDAHGHLKDFKNEYVRRSMYDPATGVANLTYTWWKGKIYPGNQVTTLYWADMNPTIDINGDGHTGMTPAGAQGLDAVLPTDVRAIDEANGWGSLINDELGDVTPAEIQERIDAITAHFDALNGVSPTNPDPMVHPWIRLGIVVVPFKNDHNVGPADHALGSNGCTDCHNSNPGEGMFSRNYRMQGDLMTNLEATGPDMSGTPATNPFYGYPTQVMPFGMDMTGAHNPPMNDYSWFTVDRNNNEIWASVFSLPTGASSTQQLRDMTTSELLYNVDDQLTPVGTTTPLADRAAWVTYLNNINAAAYNISPTAAITSLPTTIQVGTTIPLNAVASAAAGSAYYWTVNDVSAATVANTGVDPDDPAPGQTSSWTFTIPGTWKVMLTVVGPNGDVVQSAESIQVLRQLAATSASASGMVSGSASATINLSNIPAHDQISFFFGDGTRLSVADGDGVTAGGSLSQAHSYRLRDTFFDGGTSTYDYTTSVQVKNAGAIVEVINIDVVIPQ